MDTDVPDIADSANVDGAADALTSVTLRGWLPARCCEDMASRQSRRVWGDLCRGMTMRELFSLR